LREEARVSVAVSTCLAAVLPSRRSTAAVGRGSRREREGEVAGGRRKGGFGEGSREGGRGHRWEGATAAVTMVT
jgi:hypothetical protein